MDAAAYRQAVAGYGRLKPRYDELAVFLRELMEALAEGLGLHPIVQARAKSMESFAEKIARPGKSYSDPLCQITDFCGVRVIVHTLDELDALESVLGACLDIDRGNSEDKLGRLRSGEFGYRSRHYIVSLREGAVFPVSVPERAAELMGLKAELQLRTMAQHIWADLYHELGYKNEFRLPAKWERELARAAALLEACDQSFVAVKSEIAALESNYSGYMSEEELRDMAVRLEILVEAVPEDPATAHKLLRVWIALSEWERAAGFARARPALMARRAALLRDAGMATCKAAAPAGRIADEEEYRRGLDMMRSALEAAPGDVETLSCLGGALKLTDPEASRAAYVRALEADPGNPYPLGNFIEAELSARRDPSILEYMRSGIAEAASRCRRQAEAGANLPWAFYDLSRFSLWLGRPMEALSLAAQAMLRSPKPWMVASAARGLRNIAAAGVKLEGMDVLLALFDLSEKVASPIRDGADPVAFGSGRLVIAAGGCAGADARSAPAMEALFTALSSFNGTVISGGTSVGVPGSVGRAAAANPGLRAIGYLPDLQEEGRSAVDGRYTELRFGHERTFSAAECIHYWTDILGTGIDPRRVKLIGVNGGAISAAEYATALALGARVGLVRDSGREADAFLMDPAWADCAKGRLVPLEADAGAILAFLEEA